MLKTAQLDQLFEKLSDIWKVKYPFDTFCAILDQNPETFSGVLTRENYVEYFLANLPNCQLSEQEAHALQVASEVYAEYRALPYDSENAGNIAAFSNDNLPGG